MKLECDIIIVDGFGYIVKTVTCRGTTNYVFKTDKTLYLYYNLGFLLTV